MGRAFIVAEIGTSHGGDLERARDLVMAAASCGADAAKFQCVYADEILHPAAGRVRLPGGDIALYERFRALERGRDFYERLKAITEEAGLVFICSPFGIQSARVLRDIGTPAVKVASPELNHFPLLREIASFGCSIILSTGVSTLADIERALAALRENSGVGLKSDITLLHCVTSYPAPEEEYNIRVIPNLAAVFGLPAGVSDHSRDPVLVPVLSVLYGAAMIEKHFTLDTAGGGLDDPIALPPRAFTMLVREVRAAETERAAGRTGEALEAIEAACGRDRVRRVLGNGVKTLAAAEALNYATTRRGLHACMEIAAGEKFSAANTAILRSEKNLRPGLGPEFRDLILGVRAARTVPAGQGITWSDLLA
ncbi:MAG: N-acetylneuraminate synthase family protein [Spirochaetales bacterium]|jgi:N-acetylneuraminate synthase|nr:N-acetylneuraminate synthase family protein [Spirochaetales bacterium]